MKRDLIIVVISGVITLSTLLLGIYVDIRFALFTLVSFVIFFGYLLGLLKELFRKDCDGDDYQPIRFPYKYLMIANTCLLLIACGLFMMDFFAADETFRGLLSVIVGVFALPIIIGMYLILFCIHKLQKK